MTFAFLVLASFLTSIISATVGMAGGTVLLSILVFYFPPATAIPLHAFNQLVSNSRRAWLLRESIQKNYLYWFCGGALFGNALAAWLLKESLSFAHAPLLIALMIGYTLLKPKKMPSFKPHNRGFLVAGIVLGFLGMFIGATGLILASFFVRDDLSKEQIMATQGAMQTFSHGLKVLGFIWLGFDYLPWLLPLGLMSLATLVGTGFGVTLLKKIPQELFKILYRSVLGISGVYLLVKWAQSL